MPTNCLLVKELISCGRTSLKKGTHKRKGDEQKRKVTSKIPIQVNWQTWFRIHDHKLELYQLLIDQTFYYHIWT